MPVPSETSPSLSGKDGKSISQKLIYFREENSECIDTKGSIENFVENTKKQIESTYDSLFEI